MIWRLGLFIAFTWAVVFANVNYVRDSHPYLFLLVNFFHNLTPLFFVFLFAKKEKISLKIYPNGLKSRHFFVWFTAMFLAIIAILITTPFVEVNNILLIQLLQAWHIPLKTMWWSAPLLMGFISLIAAFSVWMLIACGQEALFRIYLCEKWKHWNFSSKWMSISLVWFLWLVPIHILNKQDHSAVLVALKCFFFCASLTMILLAFMTKEKGLGVPAIFMGVISSYESSLQFISPSASAFYYGVSGWVGAGVFFVAALVAFILTKHDLISTQTIEPIEETS